MDQRTHAWIAIRAIKLLEDEGQSKRLVDLLKPFTQEAAIGAWIPDKTDAKLGGSQTQNHVFKISPYINNKKKDESRFIVTRTKLTDRLGPERQITGFINKYSDILDNNWWDQSYKADPSPGRHLANRVMALSINNIDMLILGNPVVQELVPGKVGFIDKVPEKTRCTEGQVALFFSMLSHFIADSMMPCHCDERDLSDYNSGLHMELEKDWSKKVGTYFIESNLIREGLNDEDVLARAVEIDDKFEITFENHVPEMKSDDVWEEIVMICRGSFALASIIAPPNRWPYKPQAQIMAPFETLFEQDQQGKDLLKEINRVILHDAVMNVAIIWKFIWNKFH